MWCVRLKGDDSVVPKGFDLTEEQAIELAQRTNKRHGFKPSHFLWRYPAMMTTSDEQQKRRLQVRLHDHLISRKRAFYAKHKDRINQERRKQQ